MINEILKEIGSIKNKDDKELFKQLKVYLSGEKLENSIKSLWDSRENNKIAIQHKYPNLIKQMSFFALLLMDINYFKDASYKEKKEKAKIKYRYNVSAALYNKSLQTFLDVFGLLVNGSVSSTFLLWRSIYENFVISKYLVNSTEEEANLFNDYEIIQRYKLIGKKPTKEEREVYVKKFGRDFETNDYCWAKSLRGKKTFLKVVRSIKENKLFKFYLLSAYQGHSSSFTVNKGFEYHENSSDINRIGFYPDEVTKSLNAFIAVMSEFANLMVDNYVDDKKSRETLKKLVLYYGKEIDKKWKKYQEKTAAGASGQVTKIKK